MPARPNAAPLPSMRGFSGSYDPSDVIFLLNPVGLTLTDVAEKEALIQSGKRHYATMLSPEAPPSARYMRLFHDVFAETRARFARDLATVAAALDEERRETSQDLVLVSLARAGTPVGVLLRRALGDLGPAPPHYSLSIIRGIGIDGVALRHVLALHPGGRLIFVDGWTGKGAIARELDRSISAFNAAEGAALEPGLVVVADPAGQARLAASGDDRLIPNAILNATISGLVSRSVLNDEAVGPGRFHACHLYDEWSGIDLSRWFVDAVHRTMAALGPVAPARWTAADRERRRGATEAFVAATMRRGGLKDVNRVKPGIGEATRAVLRRVPEAVFVRNPDASAVAHLVALTKERGVTLRVDPGLPAPWQAVAIIKTLGAG